MKSSQDWIDYFTQNSKESRINWTQNPNISTEELKPILKSIQAWQLGESSDGKNLLRASSIYSEKINDENYLKAIDLFIKEEQKHGNNLGRYLDKINQPRVKKNWGDTMFRKVRYFNTSIEFWTLAVITVESSAQIFYQCLKKATNCNLLKEICTDILIDEAPHIQFQKERMQIIYNSKPKWQKPLIFYFYMVFFFSTAAIVWFAHRSLFKAGGVDLTKYFVKMKSKYHKVLGRLNAEKSATEIFEQKLLISS